MRHLVALVACVTTLMAAASAAPAHATAPGKNGRIAFSIDRGHGYAIDTIRRNGTGLVDLVYWGALNPAWSPDGRTIVFELHLPTRCSISTILASGSSGADLTGRQPGCFGDPSFTPDGRRIVFLARRGSQIRSMNVHGGNVRTILARRRLDMFDPNVSPDGRTVTFVMERGRGRALYRIRLNGSHLRQIVPFRFDVGTHYGWAPDGRHIVFTEYSDHRDGHSPNIVTIRPDGSGWTQITHEAGTLSAGGASYSPNGRQIVYVRHDDEHGTYALFKMHPDGGEKTRIRRFRYQPVGIAWGPQSQ
jgi:TolB protein